MELGANNGIYASQSLTLTGGAFTLLRYSGQASTSDVFLRSASVTVAQAWYGAPTPARLDISGDVSISTANGWDAAVITGTGDLSLLTGHVSVGSFAAATLSSITVNTSLQVQSDSLVLSNGLWLNNNLNMNGGNLFVNGNGVRANCEHMMYGCTVTVK